MTLTYSDLLRQLETMTALQLAQEVRIVCDDTGADGRHPGLPVMGLNQLGAGQFVLMGDF